MSLSKQELEAVERATLYIYYHKNVNNKLNHLIEYDDFKQECLIKVWKASLNQKTSFRGDSQFTSWVHQICKNAYINMVKSLKSDKRNVMLMKVDIEDSDKWIEDFAGGQLQEETSQEIPSLQTSNLEEDIIYREIGFAAYRYAARKFRGDIWKTYRLYFSGLKYDEIASIMKVPMGTVRSRIFKVKHAIHNYVKNC